MKYKGNVLLALLVAMTLLLAPVAALADPPGGLITANPKKNIVRDPLIDSAGDRSGWVTFACQSLEGLQCSAAVKDLDPRTTYDVRAESLGDVFLPVPLPGALLLTRDGDRVEYSLGTITTNGEGEGEVTGLVSLLGVHDFLPFGLYNWEIIVADATGDVLWTMSDDSVDFLVFWAWS